MANDEAPKPSAPDPAAALNKAQAEFQRYTKRVQGQQGVPVYVMPYPQGADAGPLWAVPPSIAMLPHRHGGPGFPSAAGAGDGSLSQSLGATIRLGVEAINAALAGSARFLNGISDMAHGYGGSGHESCGCGCESCCEQSCCSQDCCDCCEPCCHPSVGSCC
jgi:hypothetical protein